MPQQLQLVDLDFTGASRVLGLPRAIGPGQPATWEDLQDLGAIKPAIVPLPGSYFILGLDKTSSALSTVSGANHQVQLSPIILGRTVRIDRIGVNIVVAAPGNFTRFYLYGSDSNGLPANLIGQSAPLTLDVIGPSEVQCDFTFTANSIYWVGVRSTSTFLMSAIGMPSAAPLPGTVGISTTPYHSVRRTIAVSNPLPANWGYDPTELNEGLPVAFWGRVWGGPPTAAVELAPSGNVVAFPENTDPIVLNESGIVTGV
jgi:hypothetical protein